MGGTVACHDGACTGETDEPHFSGRWVTSKGNVHFIGLEAIQWSNGDVSPFVVQRHWGRLPTCATNVRGKTFTAELKPDDTLVWSDGDIWVRDTRKTETPTKELVSHIGHSIAERVFKRTRRNKFAIPLLRKASSGLAKWTSSRWA